MLTYAEELRQEKDWEGLQKGPQKGLETGEIKGKVETIESLLAVGADWWMIRGQQASHRMSLRRLQLKPLCRSARPATTTDWNR